MSTVLAEVAVKPLVPQIDNNSYYYNEQTKKTYFKVFILNNKFNKRKFRVSNPHNLNKDVDGYENLPVTFVSEGPRKGNHPNPKDANIFEANYQNRYTYVTKAIDYYRTFGLATIKKIYKPDSNMLTASATNPDSSNILNYFGLCETDHPTMIQMLKDAREQKKNIYVSPAMFSWDWQKDPDTGYVNVNSFVPTHLAIVDSPAFDPEIAYIKKETCQKDGVSCYYELFEANDIENLNNDSPQTNNMSSNKFPITLEEYVKSYYGYDVVDQKSINAEELVKNLGNLIIIDKDKVLKNGQQQQQPAPVPTINNAAQPVPTNQPVQQQEQAPKKEQEQPQPTKKSEEKKEQQQSDPKATFSLDDVRKLLVEQEERILNKIKAEQTKGEREQLLDTYIQNEKVKEVKDKINLDQLNKTRELYNTLPLDNNQLKAILDNSIYNPKVANPDIYTSILSLPEQQKTEQQPQQQPQANSNETQKVNNTPKDPIPPKANTSTSTGTNNNNTKPITDIPSKPNTSINMYGTEFKSSAESTNKYNDSFKGNGNSNNFNASKSDNEYRPVPSTGEGVPKRFQKYIQ